MVSPVGVNNCAGAEREMNFSEEIKKGKGKNQQAILFIKRLFLLQQEPLVSFLPSF
jgi:hypothetical protein